MNSNSGSSRNSSVEPVAILNLIHGEFVPARSGKHIDSPNPATGKVPALGGTDTPSSFYVVCPTQSGKTLMQRCSRRSWRSATGPGRHARPAPG